MTTLEEELKRLKSSLNDQNNKNAFISYALNKSKDTITSQELKVNSISKSYNKRKVVNKVSLKLNRGEAVGLLGPNGAGKTTCFYMIAGLIDTDEGDIFLNQERINHLPMHMRSKEGIGYLPQESSIFRGLTVEENILSVLEVQKYDKNYKFQILEELLAEFNLNKIRNSNGATLSGGERRRTEIARALASSPSFILLDEPLAGIDPIAINDVRNLINKLKSKNIGVLITDHNVRETLSIVDRAYILFDGSVIMSGSPSEIKIDRTVRDVYLGNNF
ncbi:MAG: LPS export ABC transporter ATP-binding protein [Alphaproteobacteria bacterium TMED199]|nr:MAG: LPS export ABC transporter ATP-binding protein [Alphaproteobacteria bacterium TMED199]